MGIVFFYAIGFQLSNILQSSIAGIELSSHLNSLGITADMSNQRIATILRQLLVEEWNGDRKDDYMQFLPSNCNYSTELSNYENDNFFGGCLGDLMPIAMANVLNIPLTIISSQPHTPILSVCPERTIPNATPIFLAYNSFGPGHYDAAVLMESPTDVQKGDLVYLLIITGW